MTLPTRVQEVAPGCCVWLRLPAVKTHKDAGRGPLEIAKRLTGTPEFDALGSWESRERLYVNVANRSTASSTTRVRSPATRSPAPARSTASPAAAST